MERDLPGKLRGEGVEDERAAYVPVGKLNARNGTRGCGTARNTKFAKEKWFNHC